MKTRNSLFLAAWIINVFLPLCQPANGDSAPRAFPRPDISDAKYGPYTQNLLDLWKAKSDKPTPLLVYIHGGGFQHGSKGDVNVPLLNKCLAAGISVASIDYRLMDVAPFPAPMHDGARAVQFLRSKATEWNLDPRRVACGGSSAGGGISLWLAFHDDLANPKSDDPVARESTRLSCAAVTAAQTSYDPRWVKNNVSERTAAHPGLRAFYGLKENEVESPQSAILYQEASPAYHVSADDPPVFLYYLESGKPIPDSAPTGSGIHHPKFGIGLKRRLDPLKIECVLTNRVGYIKGGDVHDDMVKFLGKHFGMNQSTTNAAASKSKP